MIETKENIFPKIFIWLCIGLFVTFGTGYYIQDNEPLLNTIFGGPNYFLIWIAELIIAIVLSRRIHKMSHITAIILYLVFAGLTGLTFSTIFILYRLTSIMYVFGISAGVFLVFGVLGYTTKIDLSKLSTFLMIAILGIILLSVVSIFVESVALNLGLTIVSLLIFIVYVAYDIQMIKRRMYNIENEDSFAVYGAFQLYLDFINIFLDLISLFGDRK